MRIELSAGTASDAMAFVRRALNKEQTRKFPILGAAIVEANGNTATVIGTNLDMIGIATCLVDVQEPGRIAIEMQRLAKLADGFHKEVRLVISSNGTVAKLSSGRSRHSLPLLPADFL